MEERKTPPTPVNEKLSPRLNTGSEAQWENEGGAAPETSPKVATAASSAVPITVLEAVPEETPVGGPPTAVDERQDEIMTFVSPDGRPPPRWLRVMEWRFIALAGIPIITAIVAWIVIKGINWVVVVAALAYGVMLLMGLSPVIAAALQRGREERAARRLARFELEHGPAIVIRAEQMAIDAVTPA